MIGIKRGIVSITVLHTTPPSKRQAIVFLMNKTKPPIHARLVPMPLPGFDVATVVSEKRPKLQLEPSKSEQTLLGVLRVSVQTTLGLCGISS